MSRTFLLAGGWLLLGASTVNAADQPLRVVALTSVLTEIAATIGGDAVAVEGLVPAATDPHAFDPTPQDIRRCVEADVVLASGLGLEPYLERIVTRVGISGRIVVVASALQHPVTLDARDGDGVDPHWWHSPAAVRDVSALIAATFIAMRPGAAEAMRERLRGWDERLAGLESWARAEVAQVPADRRQLVTSHDAFGWLARDLGFTVHPIKGLSAEAEPSGRHMAELVDLIRRRHIPTIFAENVENPRLLQTLSAETGARLGGTLFADGPGAPGSGVETYEAMYRHNVATIVTGLAEK